MIPFRDNIKSATRPVVTLSLIIFNSLVFPVRTISDGVVPINLFQSPASGQSLPSVGILSLVNIRPHRDPYCRTSAEKSWAIGGNDRSGAGSPRIIRSASSPSLARKQATRDWRIPLIPSAMLSVAMKACPSEARSLASSKSTWGARTFDTRGEVDEDGRGQDGRPLSRAHRSPPRPRRCAARTRVAQGLGRSRVALPAADEKTPIQTNRTLAQPPTLLPPPRVSSTRPSRVPAVLLHNNSGADAIHYRFKPRPFSGVPASPDGPFPAPMGVCICRTSSANRAESS